MGGRRRVLRLALPAVDLAPPVPPHLPLQLVRHSVYGGVHVLGGLGRLEHGPVYEQRRLGDLGVHHGPVARVDQLDLGPRVAPLRVEELAHPLYLLERVPLQRRRHDDVPPLDQHVHVCPPFGLPPPALGRQRSAKATSSTPAPPPRPPHLT